MPPKDTFSIIVFWKQQNTTTMGRREINIAANNFGYSPRIFNESICNPTPICAVIMIFFVVERYLESDKEKILERQKAESIAAGIDWISPEEKLRMEEEEADRVAEEARKEELRTKCLKKGLDFEAEEAKYQTRMAEKRRIAEEKAKRKLKK